MTASRAGKAYLLLDKGAPDFLRTIEQFRDASQVPGDATFKFAENPSSFDPRLGEEALGRGLSGYSAIEITSPKQTNWGASREARAVGNQLYNSPKYFPGEPFYGAVAYGTANGGYDFTFGREGPYAKNAGKNR